MATTQCGAAPPSTDSLDDALAYVAARLRQSRRLRFVVRGVLLALGVDTVLAFLSRTGVLPDSTPLIFLSVFLIVCGIGIGAALAARRAIAPMDAARLAETRLPLKERFSSALEFESVSAGNPLLPLQRADASSHARMLDVSAAVPVRLPREAWLALPLLILLALMLWLPGLPFAETAAQRADRLTVQQAGKQLIRDARHVSSPADAQKITTLGQHMAKGRMGKAEAMAAVAEQRKQLASAPVHAGSDGGSQPAKSLSDAGRQLETPSASGGRDSQAGQSSQAKVSAAARAMRDGSPDAFSRSLQQMAGQSSSGQKSSADVLQRMANALKKTSFPETRKHLQSAADAARQGNPAQAADALRRASDAARREGTARQDAQSAQSARQALDNARRQLAGENAPRAGTPSPSHSPESNTSRGNASRAKDATKSDASHGGQSAPGGSPSPGGLSGRAEKLPFQSALPPTLKPGAQSLYLGAPSSPGGKAVSPGSPTAPASSTPSASRVPYGSALPAYRRGAEAAMDSENVPPSQRAAVRDYFNSLQNGQ